jgi:hypothetical protein
MGRQVVAMAGLSWSSRYSFNYACSFSALMAIVRSFENIPIISASIVLAELTFPLENY